MANLTTAQVAAEIVGLINCRPHSPRTEEIEAIVAKVAACGSGGAGGEPISPTTSALKAAIAAVDEEIDRTGFAEDETTLPFAHITEQIWRRPIRTLDDLRQRALIAEHWHKHADHTCVDAELRTIEGPWVNPNDVDDWGERAVAHLIHAALGFAEG